MILRVLDTNIYMRENRDEARGTHQKIYIFFEVQDLRKRLHREKVNNNKFIYKTAAPNLQSVVDYETVRPFYAIFFE